MESRLIGGEIFEPQVIKKSRSLPNVARLSGSGLPFDLCFMHEWEFCEGPECAEGGEWLPMYREIRHVPGGNGVRTVGRGDKQRMVTSPAITGMMEKGAETIKFGDRRLGPYRKFLRRLPARGRNAWFYTLAGVKIAMLNNDTDAVPVVDQAWMTGLRRQFVAGGIAEPMSPQALDTEINKIRNRLVRFRELVEHGDMQAEAYDQRVEAGQERITAMRKAWDAQYKQAFQDLVDDQLALDADDGFVPEYGDDEVPSVPSPLDIAP